MDLPVCAHPMETKLRAKMTALVNSFIGFLLTFVAAGNVRLVPRFDQLMIKEFIKLLESFRTLVMGEFLRNFKFLFDLLQSFACGHHFCDLVSHDDEVALLFFEVFEASANMHRSVSWNVGVHRKVSPHNVVEDLDPSFYVRIENARGLSLAGVNFSIEEVAHQHDAFLRNVDREIAGAVASTFRGELEGQTS